MVLWSPFPILFLLMWSCSNVLCKVNHEKEWTDKPPAPTTKLILPPDYDKIKPPRRPDEPVVVGISVSLLNIRSVNEASLSYDVDIFFHQYWTDSRITFPEIYQEDRIVLDSKWKEQIWMPDTFFKNSRDGKLHTIIIPYSYMILFNTSEIFMAARLWLQLNCDMDLAAFPHDQQECYLDIMSLQHQADYVLLTWKEFAITKHLTLPQYDVVDHSFINCTKKYKIGTYSCLRGILKLRRRLGYYLLNTYVPSVLTVAMSFVTFWVPPTAYPARVTLSVTSLLTIVTQSYRNTLPSVSYIMALNVWVMVCIAFVFLTLLEYAMVIFIMESPVAKKLDPIYRQVHSEKKDDETISVPSSPIQLETQQERKTHVVLDLVSRIAFPLFFIVYCSTYYGVYVQ